MRVLQSRQMPRSRGRRSATTYSLTIEPASVTRPIRTPAGRRQTPRNEGFGGPPPRDYSIAALMEYASGLPQEKEAAQRTSVRGVRS